MKQSHSQMLLEHEKMTVSQIPSSTACLTIVAQLMVGNLTEEKASILDSNTELANKVLCWLPGHTERVILWQNSLDFNFTKCTPTAVKGEK